MIFVSNNVVKGSIIFIEMGYAVQPYDFAQLQD